jgi:hypothetical protein
MNEMFSEGSFCLHHQHHFDMLNKRAHGVLPKMPLRREKVNEVIAPHWMKRFPPSEFDESVVSCTPDNISQKLIDIESLFKKHAHVTDMRMIYDQLHELKGDLLTLGSDASMISTFGMINFILLDQHQLSPEAIFDKWNVIKDSIGVLDE